MMLSMVSFGQPAQRVVYYFNKDINDVRTYFKTGDSTLTVEFIDRSSSSNQQFEFGPVTLKVYPKSNSKVLSKPEVKLLGKTYPSRNSKMLIRIDQHLSSNDDSFVITIEAVHKVESNNSRKELKLNRSELYREFIRSGQ